VESTGVFQSKNRVSGRDFPAMKKLIIAANLGNVRVLKYREAGEDPIDQEHLVEATAESAKEHVSSIHETVTDQSGRFGRGGPVGFQTGMSYGEEHELKATLEKAALKKIASRIDSILSAEDQPQWALAAPRTILAALEKNLSATARKTLTSTVGADLTRCPLKEMEKRFLS
jgi:hypothetical protein